MTKYQTRGNCPCCGRDQAVLASGLMSKHGYTVDHGWFNGVCSGQNYRPLQEDRAITDTIVATVRKEVAELIARADDIEAGRVTPTHVPNPRRRRTTDPETVRIEDLSDYDRASALKTAEYALRNRARAGISFADDLEALADRVHGQPLRQVPVEEAPAPIAYGEKRVTDKGSVLTVVRVEGARVYWKNERGFKSWTGTQAFRKLPLVTE